MSPASPHIGQNEADNKLLRRRRALTAGVGLSAAAFVLRPGRAFAATDVAAQNVIGHGADPTGIADSSAAFVSCFNNLPAMGGSIYVPAGVYRLNSPLSFASKPLVIYGDGSAASILMMNHTGVAISFAGTNTNYPSVTPFTLEGLGIAGPTSGSPATGAISISYPSSTSETGYQYCCVNDITIGVADLNASNGCNIAVGLTLANVWKSQFTNVRMFGPFGSGTFVSLTGSENVDNWFVNCVADGPYYGFNVGCYCEGIRIIQPLLITQVGFTSNFANSRGTNVLGLYISGGEFNTFVQAADFYQVSQGYISDTHFRCTNPNAPAVITMESCVEVRMANLIIEGPYPSGGNSASVFGVNLGGALCQINGALLTNLANGIQFLHGSASNNAVGLQIVNEAAYPQLLSTPAAIDNSGNTGVGVNNAQWQVNSGQFRTLY